MTDKLFCDAALANNQLIHSHEVCLLRYECWNTTRNYLKLTIERSCWFYPTKNLLSTDCDNKWTFKTMFWMGQKIWGLFLTLPIFYFWKWFWKLFNSWLFQYTLGNVFLKIFRNILDAATGGVLWKKMLLNISQNSLCSMANWRMTERKQFYYK